MKVTVKLFASFREATGEPESVIETAPGTTISQVWKQLVEEHPRLQPLSDSAAAGLAVAIPAHAGYNYLVSRINSIVLDMERSASEIVNIVTEGKQ